MATRNEFGDICLDAEETRNFMDKMIQSYVEYKTELSQRPDWCPIEVEEK